MRTTWLIFAIVLVSWACSPEITVKTDFDKSVEVHRLTYYSWLDPKGIEERNNPLLINELSDRRIRQAVDGQLANKGYIQSDSLAQVIVHYHIVVENKTAIRTEPYGYFYTPYWMRNNSDVVRYREGTLVIDFMDTRSCSLIWRGWAVSILDDQNMITEELIQKAVQKIFEAFPTAAAKEVKI